MINKNNFVINDTVDYIGNILAIDIITRKMNEIADEDFVGIMTGEKPELAARVEKLDIARREIAAENDKWAVSHREIIEKMYVLFGAYKSETPPYRGEWVVKKPVAVVDSYDNRGGLMAVEQRFDLVRSLLELAEKQPDIFGAYRHRAEAIEKI